MGLLQWSVAIMSAITIAMTLPLCLYLGLLAVLARGGRLPVEGKPGPRFALLVPAHNEAARIAQTIAGLSSLNYPRHLFRIVVIADNCTDATAIAASQAGAEVIDRTNPNKRGKGYALEVGFAHILTQTDADAVVVIDADTEASPNLLSMFATHIAAGAQALQAEYGVLNVYDSLRTRLLTVALAMFHRTRSLARDRLGLSAGLRGNGMCFTRQILQRVPHQAFGLAEDVEYGLRLALSGCPVKYVADANVRAEMVSAGAGAATQRRRWEDGRADLARRMLLTLCKQAFRRRSFMLAEIALDLATPPLSVLLALMAVGTAVAATQLLLMHDYYTTSAHLVLLSSWLLAWGGILAYAARGLQHSGLGVRALAVFAYAPVYVIRNLVWRLSHAHPTTWVRTQRESERQLCAPPR